MLKELPQEHLSLKESLLLQLLNDSLLELLLLKDYLQDHSQLLLGTLLLSAPQYGQDSTHGLFLLKLNLNLKKKKLKSQKNHMKNQLQFLLLLLHKNQKTQCKFKLNLPLNKFKFLNL